jgi:hypothetical protein
MALAVLSGPGPQEGAVISRYGPRRPFKGAVTVSCDGLQGQATLLNVCPWLSVDTGLTLKRGQSLQMRLTFFSGHASLWIALAVVRWLNGQKRVSSSPQDKLRWYINSTHPRPLVRAVMSVPLM